MNRSINAEKALLGAILLSSKNYEAVANIVEDRDFALILNVDIFRAMKSLHADGKEINIVSVAEELEGGPMGYGNKEFTYLARLASNTPTARHAVMYAEIMTGSDRQHPNGYVESTDGPYAAY